MSDEDETARMHIVGRKHSGSYTLTSVDKKGVTKIFTCAHMPDGLAQKWLQHLRDFDAANPGCHFEVGVDGPEEPFADLVRKLTIEPGLTWTKIYERAKWSRP